VANGFAGQTKDATLLSLVHTQAKSVQVLMKLRRVKPSLKQAVDTHRVLRRRGFHIFKKIETHDVPGCSIMTETTRGVRGILLVKALCYKQESQGSIPYEVIF
jgi:hypothetical protein